MKTLKDVKVGETATVAKLHGEGPVKRRIMDMGITKGVEIYVRIQMPFLLRKMLIGLCPIPFILHRSDAGFSFFQNASIVLYNKS